jgi:hypothetical protein
MIVGVVGVALAASSAFADVAVLDNNKTLTVDCAKDPEVTLTGNHITLTTKGVCARITISGNHAVVNGSASAVIVSGNHNSVVLAAGDDVLVSGNSNTVSVAKAVKLKAPRVSNTGNDNKVK